MLRKAALCNSRIQQAKPWNLNGCQQDPAEPGEPGTVRPRLRSLPGSRDRESDLEAGQTAGISSYQFTGGNLAKLVGRVVNVGGALKVDSRRSRGASCRPAESRS